MLRPRKRSARRTRAASSMAAPVQQLEQRRLLVGNVTATLRNGNLILEGDGTDNQIELTVFDGDVAVRTRGGTRINGQTGRFIAFPETDTIPRNLIVRMGGGNDTFMLTRAVQVTGDVRIEGGAGDDTIGLLRPSIDGTLKVVLGSGHDGVSIDGSEVGGIVLAGGNGRDTFRVTNSTVGADTLITSGGGNDNVVSEDVRYGGELEVTTDDGHDAVALYGVRVEKSLSLITSMGDDAVEVLDSRAVRETFIGMGGGDDDLALGAQGARNVFVGDFRANGSSGADEYDQANNVFRGSRDVTRFAESDVARTRIDKAEDKAEMVRSAVADLFVYRTHDLTASPLNVQESVGAFISRTADGQFKGRTTNDALLLVDTNGDGFFDNGSMRADEFGKFTVPAELAVGLHNVAILSLADNGEEQILDITMHRAVGSVARFNTSLGFFDVELLDEDAPLTVANYKGYFDDDSHALIHRSVNNFVIQGGGYEFVDGQLDAIETDPPVKNEFNAENSNLRGTLSTALLSGQPDSATNQWFINLRDNTFLDDAKHTVFGRVIGDGMDVVDAIADVDVFNLDGGAFRETPLRDYRIFSEQLTGTVSVAAGSTTLFGTGTLFTEELSIGSRIRLQDGDRTADFTVAIIKSDTELTLSTAATEFTDATAFTHETIGEDHFVFNDIEELLDF